MQAFKMEEQINKNAGVETNYSPIGLGLGAILKALEQEEKLGSNGDDRQLEDFIPIAPLCEGCSFTEYQAIKLLFGENRNATRFLESHGILTSVRRPVQCKDCKKMAYFDASVKGWKCRTKPRWVWTPKKGPKARQLIRCRLSTSPLKRTHGTFLAASKVRYWKVALMAKAFCHKRFSHRDMVTNLGVSLATSHRYHQIFCRATQDWVNRQQPIGGRYPSGDSRVVELDETLIVKFRKAKGNTRNYRAIWIFGGIERHSDRCFIIPLYKETKEPLTKGGIKNWVEALHRDSATLIPLIKSHVAEGSHIITDGWSAYLPLTREGFIHSRVIHEENFVKPGEPHIHTQRIERLWGDLKEWILKRGIVTRNIKSYVGRYLFVRTRKGPETALHDLLCLLGNQRPLV